MKRYSYIAGALALAAMTGCAEFHDTDTFIVQKPESIQTYEYLDAYEALNSYIDRGAHPNFKLGVATDGPDYYNRSGLYALACSNFDMYVPRTDLMYGKCVSNEGSLDLEPARKIGEAAAKGEMEVFGYALTSTTNHNGTWMRNLLASALNNLSEDDKITDFSINFGECTEFPFSLINDFQPTIQDGVLLAQMSNKKHQIYVMENVPTSVEYTYEISMRWKGSRNANLTLRFGTNDNSVKVPVTVEWTDFTVKLPGAADVSSLIVDPANTKINLEIEYVVMKHQRPLTDAERTALYVDEMDRWVGGLIEKTGGVINNWCLANEPLADSGEEDGYLPLKHAPLGSKTECYWQDVMGDIDFVKVAYEKAKAHQAEVGDAANLKFFVTEKNLGDAHQLASLMYWISKWEAAGVKVDGLGTKMQVACHLDANAQADAKAEVEAQLAALAATGREVMVTELTLVLYDADGRKVATADMDLAQQKAVAECYGWFVKTYFAKVPQAQQAGVCLWNPTDGLWSAELNRLPAYAGFADALQGK